VTIGQPSPAASRYIARTMLVPNSRRERVLRLVRRPAWAVPSQDDPLVSLLSRVLANGVLQGRSPSEIRTAPFIDEDQDGRKRLLALFFDAAAEMPFAVAKVQIDLRTGSLQPEVDGLHRVAELLPPQLKMRIPEILYFEKTATGEVLIVSALPGRSAWFDLKASLMPSLMVDAHFDAAARWLSTFQNATRREDRNVAGHGDFWPHNVLLDRNGTVSVVDWEHFRDASSPFVDLFQYPLTYGIAYPWRLYHSLPPARAFERTFLDRNRVSRAVRRYLENYTAASGMPWSSLSGAFREFLITRGTMDASSSPLPGLRQLPWSEFISRFDAASVSVFSS
jgi:hypothetical protein